MCLAFCTLYVERGATPALHLRGVGRRGDNPAKPSLKTDKTIGLARQEGRGNADGRLGNCMLEGKQKGNSLGSADFVVKWFL